MNAWKIPVRMWNGEWRLYTVFNHNRVYAVQAAAAIARKQEETKHPVKKKYRGETYYVQKEGAIENERKRSV